MPSKLKDLSVECVAERNLIRITLPDGSECRIQYKTDPQYGARLEVNNDSGIALLPIVGANGIAIKV